MSISSLSSQSAIQQQLTANFMKRADTSGDGSVDLAEFEALGKNDSTGQNVPAQSSSAAQDLFSAMDADGNGQVTSSEVTNFAQQFSSGAFGSMLSAQEGSQSDSTSASGSSAPTSLASALFDDADTDQSGGLSLDEFTNEIDKLQQQSGSTQTASSSQSSDLSDLFQKLDANGDGQLSSDELSKGLKHAHHGHHGGSGAQDASASSSTTDPSSATASTDTTDATDPTDPASSTSNPISALFDAAITAYRAAGPALQTSSLAVLL